MGPRLAYRLGLFDIHSIYRTYYYAASRTKKVSLTHKSIEMMEKLASCSASYDNQDDSLE